MDPQKENFPATRRLLHINHPTAILRLIERFCLTKKFSVDAFESASAGFHYALSRKYHIVVLGLPTRGLEPERFLKGLLRAKINTPVLIMADSLFKNKGKLEKYANVIGFISKPLDINEFSKYLDTANKPPELIPQEMEKLLIVLRKWEEKVPNAH